MNFQFLAQSHTAAVLLLIAIWRLPPSSCQKYGYKVTRPFAPSGGSAPVSFTPAPDIFEVVLADRCPQSYCATRGGGLSGSRQCHCQCPSGKSTYSLMDETCIQIISGCSYFSLLEDFTAVPSITPMTSNKYGISPESPLYVETTFGRKTAPAGSWNSCGPLKVQEYMSPAGWQPLASLAPGVYFSLVDDNGDLFLKLNRPADSSLASLSSLVLRFQVDCSANGGQTYFGRCFTVKVTGSNEYISSPASTTQPTPQPQEQRKFVDTNDFYIIVTIVVIILLILATVVIILLIRRHNSHQMKEQMLVKVVPGSEQTSRTGSMRDRYSSTVIAPVNSYAKAYNNPQPIRQDSQNPQPNRTGNVRSRTSGVFNISHNPEYVKTTNPSPSRMSNDSGHGRSSPDTKTPYDTAARGHHRPRSGAPRSIDPEMLKDVSSKIRNFEGSRFADQSPPGTQPLFKPHNKLTDLHTFTQAFPEAEHPSGTNDLSTDLVETSRNTGTKRRTLRNFLGLPQSKLKRTRSSPNTKLQINKPDNISHLSLNLDDFSSLGSPRKNNMEDESSPDGFQKPTRFRDKQIDREVSFDDEGKIVSSRGHVHEHLTQREDVHPSIPSSAFHPVQPVHLAGSLQLTQGIPPETDIVDYEDPDALRNGGRTTQADSGQSTLDARSLESGKNQLIGYSEVPMPITLIDDIIVSTDGYLSDENNESSPDISSARSYHRSHGDTSHRISKTGLRMNNEHQDTTRIDTIDSDDDDDDSDDDSDVPPPLPYHPSITPLSSSPPSPERRPPTPPKSDRPIGRPQRKPSKSHMTKLQKSTKPTRQSKKSTKAKKPKVGKLRTTEL